MEVMKQIRTQLDTLVDKGDLSDLKHRKSDRVRIDSVALNHNTSIKSASNGSLLARQLGSTIDDKIDLRRKSSYFQATSAAEKNIEIEQALKRRLNELKQSRPPEKPSAFSSILTTATSSMPGSPIEHRRPSLSQFLHQHLVLPLDEVRKSPEPEKSFSIQHCLHANTIGDLVEFENDLAELMNLRIKLLSMCGDQN